MARCRTRPGSGPNFGTSNQSLRGFLLRVGPEGVAGTAIWLVLVAVVGVFGYRLAREMWLRGDSIGEVAVVGLLACLLSPVAWIHHFHWVVVVVFALLGAQPWRSRRRLVRRGSVVAGAGSSCGCRGGASPGSTTREWPELPGRVLQNADVAGGLVALGLLWWVSREPGRRQRSDDADDLQGADRGEDEADAAADAADRREPDPLEQGAAQQGRQA